MMEEMMKEMKESAMGESLPKDAKKLDQLKGLMAELDELSRKVKAALGEESMQEESDEPLSEDENLENAQNEMEAENNEDSGGENGKNPKVAMVIAMLKKKRESKGKV